MDSPSAADERAQAEAEAETPVSIPASSFASDGMDSVEHFARARSLMKEGMKEVCTEQMDSLEAAVQQETRSFQQRLADSDGDCPSIPETMRVLSNALTESVRQHTAQLEGRLETMLDHVSVCLQEELSREQEHLMLMQHKLDSHATALQRGLADVNKRMDADKSARVLMQRTVRDNKEQMVDALKRQQLEIDELRARAASSGLKACARSAWGAVTSCLRACAPVGGVLERRRRHWADDDEGDAGSYEPLTRTPLATLVQPLDPPRTGSPEAIRQPQFL